MKNSRSNLLITRGRLPNHGRRQTLRQTRMLRKDWTAARCLLKAENRKLTSRISRRSALKYSAYT